MSPYVGFADNPVYYIDEFGNEPDKAQSTTVKAFISDLRKANVNNIIDAYLNCPQNKGQ